MIKCVFQGDEIEKPILDVIYDKTMEIAIKMPKEHAGYFHTLDDRDKIVKMNLPIKNLPQESNYKKIFEQNDQASRLDLFSSLIMQYDKLKSEEWIKQNYAYIKRTINSSTWENMQIRTDAMLTALFSTNYGIKETEKKYFDNKRIDYFEILRREQEETLSINITKEEKESLKERKQKRRRDSSSSSRSEDQKSSSSSDTSSDINSDSSSSKEGELKKKSSTQKKKIKRKKVTKMIKEKKIKKFLAKYTISVEDVKKNLDDLNPKDTRKRLSVIEEKVNLMSENISQIKDLLDRPRRNTPNPRRGNRYFQYN